ncbi:MAG: tetratricopeptide repeat protein [Pyrinomonadaceae bacterium]
MATKKRRFQPVEADAGKPKEAVRYEDRFQQTVSRRIEGASKALEGKGRTILYGLAALAVVAVLIGVVGLWNKRSNATAQTALGKAIETSRARISEAGAPAGSTEKVFKSERERAEAAIAEFQSVAEKFGGSVGEKARYFAAVTRLLIDRPAGIAELEALKGSGGPVGDLSKYALAQAYAGDGKFEEAIKYYQELSAVSAPVIPKETVDFELAGIYEKQGKTQEAADIYFSIAKTASEAKDSEGKPVPMTETARSAKEKLEKLDPQRAGQIQEPAPVSPFGG